MASTMTVHAEPLCPPDAVCEELPASTPDPEAETDSEAETDAEAEIDSEVPDDSVSEGEGAEPGSQTEAEDDAVLVAPERPADDGLPRLASEHDGWSPDGGEPRSPRTYVYGESEDHGVEQAGIGIFAATYGIPFFVGAIGAGVSDTNPDAAPLMALMIPFIGPSLTGLFYEVGPEAHGLLAATGGMQAVGLIVWAIGASLPDSPSESATVRPTPDGLIVRF